MRCVGGEFDVATMLGTCNAPTTGNACQMSAVDVRCVGIGVNSVTRNVCADPVFNAGTSQLPAWFTANRWQDYVYYEMTRPTDTAGITVGSRLAGAMIATTGRPINPPQIRPSCALSDYLDSAMNVNTEAPINFYDSTSKQRTNNYNDQTFVVAP